MKFATSVGSPMPRFTVMPSLSSRATRRAISSLVKPADIMTRCLDDALYKNPRRHDTLRVELTRLDNLLHLGDRYLRGSRHRLVEIAPRLPVRQIPQPVGLVAADEGEISCQCALHQIPPALELARFLSLRHHCPHARRRVKRRDAGAAGTDALRQRALGHQLQLD